MRPETEVSVVVDAPNEHLDPSDVVAYVDRVATDDSRARIESHLARCVECRAEVSDARRIIGGLTARRRRSRNVAAAAAIAAALILVVSLQPAREPVVATHREAPVSATVTPVAMLPRGVVDSAPGLVWSSVPHADQYEVRVFNADGTVIWSRETTDTITPFRPGPALRPGVSYYWKVEARTGFGRAPASDLVEFSVRRVQER